MFEWGLALWTWRLLCSVLLLTGCVSPSKGESPPHRIASGWHASAADFVVLELAIDEGIEVVGEPNAPLLGLWHGDLATVLGVQSPMRVVLKGEWGGLFDHLYELLAREEVDGETASMLRAEAEDVVLAAQASGVTRIGLSQVVSDGFRSLACVEVIYPDGARVFGVVASEEQPDGTLSWELGFPIRSAFRQ